MSAGDDLFSYHPSAVDNRGRPVQEYFYRGYRIYIYVEFPACGKPASHRYEMAHFFSDEVPAGKIGILVGFGIQETRQVGQESNGNDGYAVIGLPGQYFPVELDGIGDFGGSRYGMGIFFYQHLRPLLHGASAGRIGCFRRADRQVWPSEINVEDVDAWRYELVLITGHDGQRPGLAFIGQGMQYCHGPYVIVIGSYIGIEYNGNRLPCLIFLPCLNFLPGRWHAESI